MGHFTKCDLKGDETQIIVFNVEIFVKYCVHGCTVTRDFRCEMQILSCLKTQIENST